MNRSIFSRVGAIGAVRSAWVLSLLVALSGPSDTFAQDVPVEFNHGFANQGTAWVSTADYLRERYQITTLTPSTPWDQTFGTQSSALRDALNSWGRAGVIGVAHSNGGLVGRTYVQQNGSGSRINRIATIGSPHRGAEFATNVINGRVFNYFGSMAGSIGNAFNYYSTWDPDWNIHPVVDASTGYAFDALYYVGNYFAYNSRFIGLGFASGIPVTQQDVPGSTFISQLNSTSSLSTESSVLQKRVGVSTQVHPVYAFFSLISSRPQDWRRARAIAKHGALALYFYYREHPDYWLSMHAGYWLEVYWYLYVMDVAWHDFVGALYFDAYGFPRARPSDGFIPHSSSAYPNATVQYNLDLPDYHISHTEQKDHSAARTKFGDILQYDFGVQRRSSTYEPPPGDTCEPTSNEITCAM